MKSDRAFKGLIRSLKFKSGRNLNLNDQILPTKAQLINYARSTLCLEHTRVTNAQLLRGLPSIKDQLILLIFIFHVVIPGADFDYSSITRDRIQTYLSNKYADII